MLAYVIACLIKQASTNTSIIFTVYCDNLFLVTEKLQCLCYLVYPVCLALIWLKALLCICAHSHNQF